MTRAITALGAIALAAALATHVTHYIAETVGQAHVKAMY